jgi:MerR family transcriptional regulator, copper efflux regulator
MMTRPGTSEEATALRPTSPLEQNPAGIGRYQIGAVTAKTELSHQTLRHWDEVGLVRPSGRSEGGFRLYSDNDIQRLLVIRRMKPLEFSLDEMKRLLDCLDLLAGSDGSDEERQQAAAFVVDCHRRAEESIVRLRKRLAYAAELTEVLAREAQRVAVVTEHPEIR